MQETAEQLIVNDRTSFSSPQIQCLIVHESHCDRIFPVWVSESSEWLGFKTVSENFACYKLVYRTKKELQSLWMNTSYNETGHESFYIICKLKLIEFVQFSVQ